MRKVILGMLLFLLVIPQHTDASEREVYVALGDSLAAGQTPYTQIDAGYTDLIALQLMRHGRLAHFSKELSFPGYRIQNVIDTIHTDKAQQQLEQATLITISAGANDLLPLINHNANAGTLSFSQLSSNFALNEVRVLTQELLQLVGEKAPNATIYVMGYYFPYTSVHDEQMSGATTVLTLLNTILEQEAMNAGAYFVEVYEAFGERTTKYLPNPTDVHPNQLGYRTMANEMLEAFSGDQTLQLAEKDMPQPNPLTFEEILSQRQMNEDIAFLQGNYLATYFTTTNKAAPLMT